jgi:hypothetical protein
MLRVFDSNGNLLDSTMESGNSNSDGDGSAIFIGLANEPGIASAEFSLVSCPCDTVDFAINSLAVAPVPEPTSCILLITALGLATLAGRRRSSKN